MKKLVLFWFVTTALFGLDGMYNIKTDSFDKSEVLHKVEKKAKQINYTKLPKSNVAKQHKEKIEQLNSYLEQLLSLKTKDNTLHVKLQKAQKNLNNIKNKTQKQINRKIRNYATLKRVSYYVVLHPLDEEYSLDFQNYLIDKYAITKYKQKFTSTMSDKGVESFSYTIENQKEFGLMKQEVLKEHTYREENIHVVVVKATQYPFKATNITTKANATTTKVDKFKESKVVIIPVYSINEVGEKLTGHIAKSEKSQLLKEIKKTVPIKKTQKRLYRANKQIKDATKALYKAHKENIKKLNEAVASVEAAKEKYNKNQEKIKQYKKEATKLAQYYGIELNLDELQKIVIVTPRNYSEYVEADEETDFIVRKTKKYLSHISLEGVAQKEKIIDFYDLDVENISDILMLQYASIHLLPYVEGKKLSLMVFAVLKIEKKVTQNDFIQKQLEYTTLEFLPVQKGYERIFIATTELPVSVIKQFLEEKHKRVKHYFDTYCLEDSTLPEEARDYKNVDKEYYDYPAVCYKQEKIKDILKWLSKKVGKKITLPTSSEWSYVATNANTTKYCWGNETVEELVEDEKVVENIFIDDEDYPHDGEPRLQKVKSFPASKLGMYDMCGNGYELVQEGGEFMIKGNSYISYIEESDAPALEYDYTLNPLITLRVVYRQKR